MVVNAVSASNVTAPVKVCVPLVVMLLASVEVPLTTKLEVPVVLVMLLPLAIVRLATVWAACRSQTAAPVIATFVEVDKLPVCNKVPASMFVAPVYVLAPDKVKVPAPTLVNASVAVNPS